MPVPVVDGGLKENGYLPRGVNSSFLVLIPKTPEASSIDQFRPIILGNVLFKILTKILASRLSQFVHSIVSPNPFGFIPGRSIHECIAAASEGINCLNGRALDGNLALKVDIRKLLLYAGTSCLKCFAVLDSRPHSLVGLMLF